MFYTKKWGMVSSKAELRMLVRAEHTFEKRKQRGLVISNDKTQSKRK